MEARDEQPALLRRTSGAVVWHEDPGLRARAGIVVAFSERTGGVSEPPYASLDLAVHTGDIPEAVDENRTRLLEVLGIADRRAALTCAEQVHGTVAVTVGSAEAGAGARATGDRGPIAGADALVTAEVGVPLMLLFADCVPVVLVAQESRAVAVVHAGWRGLAAGVVRAGLEQLRALSAPGEPIFAYIGAHIGRCCYSVGPEVVSQFGHKFVTIRRALAMLDMQAAVTEELESSGVPKERQCHLGICTAHNTERFYSYRAEGRTGRHAALACVLPLR
ncbi:MAG: polyphenol oxidase family protein [Coriobacteriia bacterium]|nr:polyphenol oxidase family protein [Coriobacteriia bacterium]